MHVRAIRTRLKAGMEESYDEVHRALPPELAEDLILRGHTEWLIFRHGQDLFHVITTDGDEPAARPEGGVDGVDPAARAARLKEVGEAWHPLIASHLEPVDGDVDVVDLHLVWSLSKNGGD